MIYKPSKEHIARAMRGASRGDLAARRLKIDLSNLLVGPTSGSNAAALINGLFETSSADEIAAYLGDALARYREER